MEGFWDNACSPLIHLCEQGDAIVVVVFDDVDHHHGEHCSEAKQDEESQKGQQDHHSPLRASHGAEKISSTYKIY